MDTGSSGSTSSVIFHKVQLPDKVFVLLSGDLNSRTASNSQVVSMTVDVYDSLQASHAVNVNRYSQENVLSNYEKLFVKCVYYV